MLSIHLRWLLPAGMLFAATSVSGQSDPPGVAAIPSLQYNSSLAQYRRFADQPVAPWSETNQTVGAIGGWKAYAKEARQPESRNGMAVPAGTQQGARGGEAKTMPESHEGHGVKR